MPTAGIRVLTLFFVQFILLSFGYYDIIANRILPIKYCVFKKKTLQTNKKQEEEEDEL